MKKISYQWQKAKSLLLAAVVSSGLAACTEYDNPVGADDSNTNVPQQVEEPTDDQMAVRVTADMPLAVLGQFEDNSMAAALIRRMQSPTFTVNADTKLALMKGSDMVNLSNDDILALARLYANGGYLAFEKPTVGQLLSFTLTMAIVLAVAEDELLTSDGDVTITPNSPAAARRATSPLAENLKSRVENIRTNATRAAGDTEEQMQEVVGEMVIFGADSYYVCEKYEERTRSFSITDHKGNLLKSNEDTVKKEYNQFRSGLMADGAAKWLNSRSQAMEERQAQARRIAATRADGSKGINELMSASDEFTFQSYLHARNENGGDMDRESAHHETIRVWGAHNTETKRDYYYVQQKVRLEIGGFQGDDVWPSNSMTLYKGPNVPKDWWIGGYDYDGTHFVDFYGAWLHSFEAKLNLNGAGNIKVEEAIPTTDNNNVSTSIAIGNIHTQTSTIGFTLGASIGEKPSFNPSFNFSHGWTDGTTYTMTTTDNAKELKCKKNTSGSQVTWTYECGKNMDPYDNNDYYCHQIAPDALINDVDIENQVCWSVSSPGGHYEISLTSVPKMRSQIKEKGTLHWCNMDGLVTSEKTFTLKIPNRSIQEWHMDVTFPEIGQEGHHGDKGKLTDYLKQQFPNIYQTDMMLADQTDVSEGTIKNLVDYSKQMLQNSNAAQTMRDYALDLGLSEYTIKWYTNAPNHNTYQLTIKAK